MMRLWYSHRLNRVLKNFRLRTQSKRRAWPGFSLTRNRRRMALDRCLRRGHHGFTLYDPCNGRDVCEDCGHALSGPPPWQWWRPRCTKWRMRKIANAPELRHAGPQRKQRVLLPWQVRPRPLNENEFPF